ncbi:MAG: sugar ABC transporter permease [Anaerolineae bacterium]|nr:sugar ABC transporter permease [Anaerolineae bacterium]
MAWNLLIPTLVVLIVVAARPLEETFITSLTDKRFAGTQTVNFVGLNNYARLLSFRLDIVPCRLNEETNTCAIDTTGAVRWEMIDRELLRQGFRPVSTIDLGGGRGLTVSAIDASFISSAGNTLFFTVVSVLLELILGLFVAMVVNSKFRGRGLMRAAMLVPWAIPTVISARLWEIMLRDNQSGILNKMLVDLGIFSQSQAWLANPDIQLWSLILVDVWKTTPFMALLLLAGLQTIPEDLYEAASVDGANRVRQFFAVTIPLLRPTIAVALVFRTLDALRVFDVFNVLLGRRKLSMATYNFETLVQNQDGGYASAIGVIIFILIFIFAVIYVRTLGVETE